jgi:hypothetical protein
LIEKGSKIAAERRDQAINNLVESTENQKGSANQKITQALVESAESEDSGIESMETTEGS